MKTNTKERSREIASTILDQLGGAVAMMGVKTMGFGDSCLTMKIGRNPKRATHVTITLASDDTYAVLVQRVPGIKGIVAGRKIVDLAKVSGVYASNLHDVLEAETGLYMRL